MIFIRLPKSLTALNTCLDEMEWIKGRDIAFVREGHLNTSLARGAGN